MEEAPKQNSIKRSITGFIISVIALASIFFGGVFLFALLLTVILVGAKEYTEILRMKGFRPSFSVIATVGVLICCTSSIHRPDLIPAILVLGTIASFLIVLFMGRQPYIANVATTELGFMYGALLPCHILLIRQIGIDITSNNVLIYEVSDGFYFMAFTFLCILATDVGAYFFGKKFGKHKLSAVISPKKTVEGAVFGTILALVISAFGIFYTKLSLTECLIGGALITFAAQVGDLSESLIKRDAGVKDSSNILPGHGGFLDRTDSYVFSLPVAYYYFINLTQEQSVIKDLHLYFKSLIDANIF